MEPARDERGDVDKPPAGRSTKEPQWSPLAMSGATSPYWFTLIARDVAAMEPARDERGDTSAPLTLA